MTLKKRLGLPFAVLAGVTMVGAVVNADTFYHTITGEDLKVPDSAVPEGRDTEAVKSFLATGVNPYTELKVCLPKGEEVYLTSCSGCHGHVGEGKVGPGLNDAYWTYPKNKTDKGLFETIYGGAQGMMGPHNDLQLDEILKAMAWIRHLYTGDVAEAEWLTPEQKKVFTPYKPEAHASAESATKSDAGKEECKVSAN
jgi:cytochrome c-L